MWMVTRRETETIVIKTKKEQIWIRYEIPAQFPVKWKERSFFARCPGGWISAPYKNGFGGGSRISLTALFTKPPARHSPGRNDPQRPFQLLAPFTAFGSFRNCTRQNHGMAGNREAGGLVNSAVTVLFTKPKAEPLPPSISTIPVEWIKIPWAMNGRTVYEDHSGQQQAIRFHGE